MFFYSLKDGNSERERILESNGVSFSFLGRFEEEVIKVVKENNYLLGGEVRKSLFESESLISKMEKRWMYNDKDWLEYDRIMEMNTDEACQIFVNYIKKDEVPEWLEVCRHYVPQEMANLFKGEDKLSDNEILDRVSFLSFRNIVGETAQLAVNRITSLAFTNPRESQNKYIFKRADLKKIISAVRERYSLEKVEWGGEVFAKDEVAKIFLGDLEHDLKIDIIDEWKNSSDTKMFIKACKKTAGEEKVKKMDSGYHGLGGGIGEGFSSNWNFGFSKATCKVYQYREQRVLLLGEESVSDDDDFQIFLFELKGNELWENLDRYLGSKYGKGLFSLGEVA